MPAYSNNYNDDEDSQPHPWKRSLWEARRQAREMYAYISPDVPLSQVINAGKRQVFAHRLTLDYWSHLAPHGEKITGDHPNLWTETLLTETVPESGATIDAGRSNMYGEYDVGNIISQLPTEERPVQLSTLREVWQQQNELTFEVTYKTTRLRESDVHRRTIHLSPRAISAVLDQLDRCLEDLNWLPEPGMQDYHAGEDEVLTHS